MKFLRLKDLENVSNFVNLIRPTLLHVKLCISGLSEPRICHFVIAGIGSERGQNLILV